MVWEGESIAIFVLLCGILTETGQEDLPVL